MKSTNRWSTRLDVQSHEPGVIYTNLCYTTSGCSFVCTVLHTCQEVLLSLWHGNEYEWYSERRQQQSQALYHRGPGSSSLSSKVFGEDLCIFWYSSGRVPRRDGTHSYIYVYKSFFVWRLSYYLNTEHSILIDDIYMSKSYADMVVGIHTQSKSVWVLFFLSLSSIIFHMPVRMGRSLPPTINSSLLSQAPWLQPFMESHLPICMEWRIEMIILVSTIQFFTPIQTTTPLHRFLTFSPSFNPIPPLASNILVRCSPFTRLRD